MERFVQKIAEAEGAPEVLVPVLEEATGAWEHKLVVESEEEKSACVRTLLELLRTCESQEVHGLALRALRLLCREASALRPLAEEEVGTTRTTGHTNLPEARRLWIPCPLFASLPLTLVALRVAMSRYLL